MIFLPKEVLYQVSKSIHSFTNRSPTFEASGEVTLSDSLLDLYQVETSKIDVKTNGSLLEIGFDFESVDPAEVDQVLKALVGQKDYFVQPYRESSCL